MTLQSLIHKCVGFILRILRFIVFIILFILFNRHGRVRSGWRFFIYIVAFILAAMLLDGLLTALLRISPENVRRFARGLGGNALSRFLTIVIATVLAWPCGRLLEDLPPRALGWALHRGWWRDFLIGTVLGVATLLLGVAFAAVFGGYRFSFIGADLVPKALKILAASVIFFIIAGAAEEVLFRGYPLQTLLRSQPAWIGIILTSILFSLVHMPNPNVVPRFTFINTALAGVWLAVAYLRTRSLWFPLGVHWAWNWALGPLLGLPISGYTAVSSAPLIPTTDRGPAWLTGGAYGIEGGAACTVAIILSTIFIWRTRLVSATEEMKRFTDEEIPHPKQQRFMSYEQPAKEEPAPVEETHG